MAALQRAAAYLLAGLIYVLWPLDVAPDFLGVVGWVDDALVAALAVYLAVKAFKKVLAERPGRSFPSPPSPEPALGQSPYEILGVERGAGPDELKAAYRREIAKYHPDKVAHLGDELKKTAEERSKLIKRAFDELSGKGE